MSAYTKTGPFTTAQPPAVDSTFLNKVEDALVRGAHLRGTQAARTDALAVANPDALYVVDSGTPIGELAISNGATWIVASSGVVIPRARASRNTAFSVTNGAAKVPLDLLELDGDPSNSMYDAANGRLVCKVAGPYLLTGMANFAASAAGSWRLVGINVNHKLVGEAPAAPPLAGATRPGNVTTMVDLAVGDTVELWTYQDSGGALALSLADSMGGAVGNVNFLAAVKLG